MPHTSSAKKRLRQTIKRREHNRTIMKQIKVAIKSLLKLAGDQATTPDALAAGHTAAIRRLDKAAAKRVIHPNLAARKKSQLARLVTARSKPAAPPAP